MTKKHAEMPLEVIDQAMRELEAIRGNPPLLSDLPTDEQVKMPNISRKVMDFIKAAERHAKNHPVYFLPVIPIDKFKNE